MHVMSLGQLRDFLHWCEDHGHMDDLDQVYVRVFANEDRDVLITTKGLDDSGSYSDFTLLKIHPRH